MKFSHPLFSPLCVLSGTAGTVESAHFNTPELGISGEKWTGAVDELAQIKQEQNSGVCISNTSVFVNGGIKGSMQEF